MQTFEPVRSKIKTTYQVLLYEKAKTDKSTFLIENW